MGRFADALRGPGLAAIAEVKRRSPSAGELRPDADPAKLALAFEAAGAAAVSILVDERFAGSLDDLRAARSATRLPLLAKGFFTEPEHLRRVEAAGASAALLLLRDVDDRRAALLLAEARRLDLDVLVEAHDAHEVERARALEAEIVGVNARDLRTFTVDRRAQLELVACAPRDVVLVAESGVETRAHGAAAELAGADAILVGSALMRALDPAEKLRDLLRRPLVKICGLTRTEDVAVTADAGADLAGFVLAASPRRAAAPLPVPDSLLSVGVFVGEAEERGTDLVQLYGEENGHRARRGKLLRDGSEVAAVMDLPWLGDDPGHWAEAAAVEGRVMLAGGLRPETVVEAIEAVRPWAVDASRSLEVSPGVKDPERIHAFVEAARS
ncbi:MAG: bifunctional indole-3-glycerol phosphate synthase/phosphoribosylanthranilate isomerase [Actinomycetota bacterium]|nr:bifunctional indole-3-glycerol phosphate synthase/phosphoribosylanthranilate isomerase [Actinomycetota bacterium]